MIFKLFISFQMILVNKFSENDVFYNFSCQKKLYEILTKKNSFKQLFQYYFQVAVEIQIYIKNHYKLKVMDKKSFGEFDDYLKSHPCVQNFINRITQLNSVQYKHKKQKYMQTEQQPLQNEELFNVSVQLFKQTLQLDDIQLQNFYKDNKFIAYIKCIQRVGVMLSRFYQQRQSDYFHEISVLKNKNSEYQQKLALYMDENQGLKQMIEHLQNSRTEYDERLNKSEHQIQRGKHQIQNEISANEYLLKENEKLKTKTQELEKQSSNLKSIIQDFEKQASEKSDQSKKLNSQLFKSRKDIDKLQKQCILLKQEKFCIEKQLQSLQILINQKDELLGNKVYKQGHDFQFSAQQNYPYYINNSIKVVTEENQDYGNDRDIMKGIQHNYQDGYKLEPALVLHFGESRSISEASEQSETSFTIDEIQINQKVSPQILKNSQYKQKRVLTSKKFEDSSVKKDLQKKLSIKDNKVTKNEKIIKTSFNQINTPIPKNKQESKQKSLTSKPRRQKQLKFQLPKNSTAESKVKIKRINSNASVILSARCKSKVDQIDYKGKIGHSQSVEDLYHSEQQNFPQKYKEQLLTKEKHIEQLKLQNRSVRQLALEQSEKINQTQYQYEQVIQKLRSQLSFYKNQFKKLYSSNIQEKSLRQAYQNQLEQAWEEISKQKQIYDNAVKELKDKCKIFMDQQVRNYKQKCEEALLKMKENQKLQKANSSDEEIQNILIQNEMQDKRGLKKSKSSSLFHNQVRHHSYNASQQYSEINNFSANHSKNTSMINIDEDQSQFPGRRNQGNIKILDFEQNSFNKQELNSYCEQKQLKQQETQTEFEQDPSQKIYQQISSKFPDSFQISCELSAIGIKTFEDYSKIKLFLQDKQEKVKRLSLTKQFQITIDFCNQTQKQMVSEFDTLQISLKNADSLCLSSEQFDSQNHFQSTKKRLNLKQESVFQMSFGKYFEKHDFNIQTQRKLLTFCKNDDLSLNFYTTKKNEQIQTATKQFTFCTIKHLSLNLGINKKSLEIQTQNKIADVCKTSQLSLRFDKNNKNEQIQTSDKTFSVCKNDFLSLILKSNNNNKQIKRQRKELNSARLLNLKIFPIKKETKSVQLQSDNQNKISFSGFIYSQNIIPTKKTHTEIQTQTLSKKLIQTHCFYQKMLNLQQKRIQQQIHFEMEPQLKCFQDKQINTQQSHLKDKNLKVKSQLNQIIFNFVQKISTNSTQMQTQKVKITQEFPTKTDQTQTQTSKLSLAKALNQSFWFKKQIKQEQTQIQTQISFSTSFQSQNLGTQTQSFERLSRTIAFSENILASPTLIQTENEEIQTSFSFFCLSNCSMQTDKMFNMSQCGQLLVEAIQPFIEDISLETIEIQTQCTLLQNQFIFNAQQSQTKNKNFVSENVLEQKIIPKKQQILPKQISTQNQTQTQLHHSFSQYQVLNENFLYSTTKQEQNKYVQTFSKQFTFRETHNLNIQPLIIQMHDFGMISDSVCFLDKGIQNQLFKQLFQTKQTQYDQLIQKKQECTQTKTKQFQISQSLFKIQVIASQVPNKNIEKLSFQQNLVQVQILPCENFKNDHNQSFNQEQLNQILLDMSQSFDMSDKFIETLKNKLLLVHENLKQMQQDKHNDSSSSDSCVQKAFRNINVSIESTKIRESNLQSSNQLLPKFKSVYFEGNIKASKDSTVCSIQTPLDSLSPCNHQRIFQQQAKSKVTQFYQIQQIQSQNIESLSKIEIQKDENEQINQDEHEVQSVINSINKSVCRQNILLEHELFNQSYDQKFESHKKELLFQIKSVIEDTSQKINSKSLYLEEHGHLIQSPKHHKISKFTAKHFNSPLNSPKQIKSPKNIIKNKIITKKQQKPEQLQSIMSQEQFQFLNRRYRPKKFQLKSIITSFQSEDQVIQNQQQNKLSNLQQKELLIIVCKKQQDNQQKQIIALSTSKIVSIKNKYILTANSEIICKNAQKLILGNHEIILTRNNLKYAFRDKVNYFSCHFPPSLSNQQVSTIKQKQYQIEKILRFKVR